MFKRQISICLILMIGIIFVILVFTSLSFASSITNGLNYLSANQNPDSSWGSNPDLQLLDTSTVLDTLKILNVGSPVYSNGITWLSNQSPLSIDFISRKILSLYMAGFDVYPDLSTLINSKYSDGGWGGDTDSTSMIINTSLALQALKAVNYSDQLIIQSAINYLLSTQNTDGGWAFRQAQDDTQDSNVYMTAMVSSTLQQFQRTTSIATAINKATDYLIALRNTDGGFGTPSGGLGQGSGQGFNSTTYETSLAYLALVNETTDATVLGNAINYLTSTQLPNGSWNDDSYSTAFALRALANVKPNLSISSNNITFSNPTPTAGETITITATIHNEGPGVAPSTGSGQVDVQFYDGDPNIIIFNKTMI